MYNKIDIAYSLVRSAIDGTKPDMEQLEAAQWWSLFRLLQQNHVAAMTAESMATLEVPREVKIPWLAESDKVVRWHRYQKSVQQEIIDAMSCHGIETMVLKGIHTAQYYPQPELREFGDLDLYFYDKHDEADRVASEALKVTVGNDAHHHSKYNYRGVTVESHYDFLNTHYPPSNRRYEVMLKELIGNPPTLEVLFLLRHMACHFAASRITLRDLVDWALTCRTLADKVDWQTVEKAIDDFGMTEFVAAIDSIAEQRLSIHLPTSRPCSSDVQSLVEHDIVYGSIDDRTGDGIGRLGWKIRRWRALGWKRKMVYNDSSLRLVLSSLISHTMKPQSILHKQ